MEREDERTQSTRHPDNEQRVFRQILRQERTVAQFSIHSQRAEKEEQRGHDTGHDQAQRYTSGALVATRAPQDEEDQRQIDQGTARSQGQKVCGHDHHQATRQHQQNRAVPASFPWLFSPDAQCQGGGRRR